MWQPLTSLPNADVQIQVRLEAAATSQISDSLRYIWMAYDRDLLFRRLVPPVSELLPGL
jgi:hypothetical protein